MFFKNNFKCVILLSAILFTSLFAGQKPDFVDVFVVNSNIVVDMQYAKENNFTGKVIYTSNKCFVLKTVAEKLNKVQKELENQNLGLKVLDGFRPMTAVKKFWEAYPNPKYVSHPEKGGRRHTRGTAVDVTLVDKDGKEIKMPTEFDDFTEKAGSEAKNVSVEAKKNRETLKAVMKKFGFEPLSAEWWHFDLKGWKNHEVLTEIDFKDIEVAA